MSEKIALIDMDGTIADYHKSMMWYLKAMAAPSENNPIEFDNREHMKYRRSFVKQMPGFWENLEPIEDGFRVVDIMREIGYSLNILTKGPYKSLNAWTEKAKWCHKHVDDANITITEDKGLVYGRVLFDDWPEYITRWLEWRPRGQVLMLEHYWNIGFKHPNVFRIKQNLDSNSQEFKDQEDQIREILTKAYNR